MSASPLFQTWCDLEEVTVSEHRLVVLTERSNTRATIEPRLDRVVLDNYDDISRLERWAKHLGMTNAAAVLEEALPTELKAQSGHVGEICLTECIPELFPTFTVPIKRLRWLDGRNMSLRGEDLIGIEAQAGRYRFLKGEAKSRARVSATVISEARDALNAHNGRPSPHAMLFVARRLDELGKDELALVFVEHERKIAIKDEQLLHVIFTFSGNDSRELLSDDLTASGTTLEQHAVGLIIADHRDLIRGIYKRLADAAQH
jgi:hypothetical protein